MYRSRSRKPAYLAVVGALAVLASACSSSASGGSEESGTPVAGGDLVYGISNYPPCIDKSINPQAPTAYDALYDKLVDQDPETGDIVPWLASSWSVEQGGQRFVFHLRDGVTFSNGEKLDAQVVADNIASTEKYYRAGVTTADQALAFFSGVQVENPSTVAVEFSKPNASFLQAVAQNSFGIVAPATLALSSDERCARGPVTSGPFVLSELVPNEKIVLTKRADYNWGSSLNKHEGAAYLNSVTFRVIPEESVRVGALSSGEIDAAANISNDNVPVVQSAGKTVIPGISAGFVDSLSVNTSDPLLAQKDIRLALLKGVDTQDIVDALYAPTDEVATSVLAKSTPGYKDVSDKLGYDPDAARTLLDGLGWVPGPNGIRVKDGQPLRFQIVYRDSEYQPQFELIQQQLKDIGVEITLAPGPAAAVTAQLNSGKWQISATRTGRADGDALLGLDPTRSAQGNGPKPELTRLLNEQTVTVDTAQRAALLGQVQELVLDEAYVIPLHATSLTHATQPSVHGLWLTPDPYRVILFDAWKES